jgi:hypothetical protein
VTAPLYSNKKNKLGQSNIFALLQGRRAVDNISFKPHHQSTLSADYFKP